MTAPKFTPKQHVKRVCSQPGCGAVLSMYNKGERCGPCEARFRAYPKAALDLIAQTLGRDVDDPVVLHLAMGGRADEELADLEVDDE